MPSANAGDGEGVFVVEPPAAPAGCPDEVPRLKQELAETRAILGAANRQLQAVLDAASELSIIATDSEGLITVFNRGAERMLGYPAHEVVGKQTPLGFHLLSEVRGRARLLNQELGYPVTGFQVFAEKTRLFGVDRENWTYVRRDGTALLVKLTVTTIHDEQGAITGFLGIAEDITRRTALEHQIADNEKLLESIINSIPNPIFYQDTGGLCIGCNDAFCACMGLPKESVIGAPLGGVAPLFPDAAGYRAELELLEESGSRSSEASLLYADGVRHDVIFYRSCIRDKNGNTSGLVGVMLDITDRKRVEQELSRREELFHLLFEKSGDANLLIDGKVFIDCNEATVSLLGYQDKHQVISTLPGDLSPQYQPDGRPSPEKAEEMIGIAYRQGSHRFEWLHKCADGSDLPVEVMLTVIPGADRRIIHTAWRDLRGHKQAEAENKQLTQNLLHAQKIESIGRLAGGVAHDFNNLLTPIMGYAEMLGTFCASDERAAKRLGGIYSAALKARDLTRQLLAFGRKQQLEMKIIDLNQTIEAFGLILERTIREDVHIGMSLDPGLGAIFADPSQIEQIIMNLSINAQDAMGAGGALSIATRNLFWEGDSPSGPDLPPGAYVELAVSDNGSGIDDETMSHVFEPFFTTKEPGKGTGLGLSTVFGIVRQHGGDLRVSSVPGRGTTFSLWFPRLAEVRQSEAFAAEPPDSRPAPGTALILLVEDSQMVREMTYDLLTGQGYRVLVAGAPDEARGIQDARGHEIDLLLSDVVMPEMNGLDLFHQLKRNWPKLKVLFMSGYSENVVTRQELLADSPNYIHKPFTSQALLARIHEILHETTA